MIATTLRKPLLAGLSATFALRICAIGLTFVQTLALTRVFGAQVYGSLSLAISCAALGLLALSLGMDQVLMRDLARVGPSRAASDATWQNTLGQSVRIVLPVTLCATVLALVLAAFLPSTTAPAFIAVALCAPILLARKFLENWWLGAGEVLRSMIGSQIVFPLVITLGAIGIVISAKPATLLTASSLYVLAALLSLGAAILLGTQTLRTTMPAQLRADDPTPFKAGRALALVSFGFLASQNIDVILTGLFTDPTQTALVRVSARVAEMLGLMRMVAVLHFKPRIAAAFGQNDHSALAHHTRLLTTLFVFSGLPLFALLWIFAEPALSLFGPEFTQAKPVLRLYLIGIGVTLLAGPCTLLLTLCNAERDAARILWIALSVNLLLDLLLIPLYGAVGCAVANVMALSVLAFLGVRATRRRLGIDPSCLFLLRKNEPCRTP